jgi:nucleotide-binding universal stress UspA family protein
MPPFRSILVDIDPTAAAHPALDRAVELARHCGARLKIVDVVEMPDDARAWQLGQRIEHELVRHRRDLLAGLAEGLGGSTVEVDVLRGRPAAALTREVVRSGHDLLVRSHARDLAARAPYGAVDLQLVRHCPCAVWVVAPGMRSAPRRIVAAVHARPDDPVEQDLNVKILETALTMSRLEQGRLVVLQAWTTFAEEVLRTWCSEDEIAEANEQARRTAAESLETLTARFGDRLGAAAVELRRGRPEEVIPEFVVEQDVDLVVLGTVGRGRLAGFLIGNTAERLLRKLVCSVVAVKPDGFVSTVRVEPED